MMRQLYISDFDHKSTKVNFTSLSHAPFVTLKTKDSKVEHARFISNTEKTDFVYLTKNLKSNLESKLLKEDPDVDLEKFGKRVEYTDQIYLSSSGQVLHQSPKSLDVIYDVNQKEIKRQPSKELEPNVNLEGQPIKWTSKYFSRKEAITKFVFKRSLQLLHHDDLTFDFLYNMAKHLDEKSSLVSMTAGTKSHDPLVFQLNGVPYRGFLDGYIQDKKFMLFLRLSNLELKAKINV